MSEFEKRFPKPKGKYILCSGIVCEPFTKWKHKKEGWVAGLKTAFVFICRAKKISELLKLVEQEIREVENERSD